MSSWSEFLYRALWYGGSTYDAWLNVASLKVASRILNFPQTTAQVGLPSSIVYYITQAALGVWSQCIMNTLYLKYLMKVQHRRQNHHKSTIQLHEVIGGLLGRRWRLVTLILNLTFVFSVSFAQIFACSNIVYTINKSLDKRTWTCIFGAVFSLSIFIPSAHNYRVWSFIGVVTSVFCSGYLTIATLLHEKTADVVQSSPHSSYEYFSGLTGYIHLGIVPIPVEIMDAMWKPQKYKKAYAFATVYMLLVVMIPSITMYQVFGDVLLKTPNALLLLPRTKFRDTVVVLLLIHMFINFGMYSLAVYAMWEKLFHVHESASYTRRTLYRIPVFLVFCITALAFPFFGIFNKLLDAGIVTWNFYIIPCVAYNTYYWSVHERKYAVPFTRISWVLDFSINLMVILWVLIVECGFGVWADMTTILKRRDFKLFAKCYNC